MNAYLNIIGLETLGLRMERECSNALELASWIENNYPDIRVNYPGLESSKWHEIAKKQLTNGYGAVSYTHLDVYKRQGQRKGYRAY